MTGTRIGSSALQAVGMARRAGCVEIGTRAVRQAGGEGRLAVILLARDASGNARERVEKMRRVSGAELAVCGDRALLGAAVGRGPVAVLGVTDSRLAELVLEALDSDLERDVLDPVAGLEA